MGRALLRPRPEPKLTLPLETANALMPVLNAAVLRELLCQRQIIEGISGRALGVLRFNDQQTAEILQRNMHALVLLALLARHSKTEGKTTTSQMALRTRFSQSPEDAKSWMFKASRSSGRGAEIEGEPGELVIRIEGDEGSVLRAAFGQMISAATRMRDLINPGELKVAERTLYTREMLEDPGRVLSVVAGQVGFALNPRTQLFEREEGQRAVTETANTPRDVAVALREKLSPEVVRALIDTHLDRISASQMEEIFRQRRTGLPVDLPMTA